MQFGSKKSNRGYTLIEVLVIVVVVAVISAIAAPSWLGFLTRQRLNAAQAEALAVMRAAQINAKREKRVWEACFWQNSTEKKVQWSAHPAPSTNSQFCTNARWQNLIGADNAQVVIDTTSSSKSTLIDRNNIYRVQFNDKGRVHGQLGKITFTVPNQNNGLKRCVYVSTLLGAMRTDSDRGCRGD